MSAEAIVSLVFGIVMFIVALLALWQGYKCRNRTHRTPSPSPEIPGFPDQQILNGNPNLYDNMPIPDSLLNGRYLEVSAIRSS